MTDFCFYRLSPRIVPKQTPPPPVILRGCCASACLFCGSTRPLRFTEDRTSAKCDGCCTIMPGEWGK
jgi:hypothetical protein